MNGYVTLLGAEQVASAASTMVRAADDMQRAASQFDQVTERLVRALEEHASRIEAVMNKEPTA